MENKEKKDSKLNEIDSVTEFIRNDIENYSGIMFYVGYSGDVIMLTTGSLSKKQQKVAERMLISADNHSIVLRIVINLEILFEKITYKLKFW
ncbi:MAG: hypothetical protein CMD08_01560 [Flavobacteriales bacterium]|nr:hypothetical protein [Flavobacteriales bacterium]|tara:strand:- start:548 stop:823 length:276 start_codon:yes stop_codon:yes gene_type:complete